jgi:cytochrome c556
MKSLTFAAAALGIGFTLATAFAHSGGKMPRPFLQRHAVMGSLAAHMKAAKAAITANDMKAVSGQAEAIHWLARMLPDTFPKGSGPEMGKTRAAPKIWEDWTGFVAASDKLATTAMALKTAAGSGNAQAAEAAFTAVGRDGCGDCHTVYRAPKH